MFLKTSFFLTLLCAFVLAVKTTAQDCSANAGTDIQASTGEGLILNGSTLVNGQSGTWKHISGPEPKSWLAQHIQPNTPSTSVPQAVSPYLEKEHDAKWSQTWLRRVSDETLMTPTIGTSWNNFGPWYNLRQHWNADNSLMLIQAIPLQPDGNYNGLIGAASNFYLLNGNTGEYIRPAHSSNGALPQMFRWSITDPDLVYYVSPNNTVNPPIIRYWKPSTDTYGISKDFSGSYDAISPSFGGGINDFSIDGKYWALPMRRGTQWYVAVWDLELDQVILEIPVPGEPDQPAFPIANCEMSRSGKYVIITSDNPWQSGTQSIPKGISVWTKEGVWLRSINIDAPLVNPIASLGGHHTLVLTENGEDRYVCFYTETGAQDRWIVSYNLEDGSRRDESEQGLVFGAYYMSGVSFQKPDMMLLSFETMNTNNSYFNEYPLQRHISFIKIDGSKKIYPVAQELVSLTDFVSADKYYTFPWATPNQDASAVLFKTPRNLDWSSGIPNMFHAYVATPAVYFDDKSDPTTEVFNLPNGTHTFSWTVTDGNGCTSTDEVVVTIGESGIQAPVVTPLIICYGQSAVLSGNCSQGTIKWFDDIILNDEIIDPSVSPSISTTYYAVCRDGTNQSSSSQMNITVLNSIATPVVTPTVSLCGGSSHILTGSCSDSGLSLIWYAEEGLINVLPNSINPNITTTYYAVCQSGSSPVCYSNYSTTEVLITSIPQTPSTTSLSIPSGGNTTLDGSCQEGSIKWFEDSNLDVEVINLTIQPSHTRAYYAICEVTTSGITCQSQVSLATITVSGSSVVDPPIVNDISICRGNSVILEGSCSEGNNLEWYSDEDLNQLQSNVTVSPISTTTYYAICVGSTQSVPVELVVTVFDPAAPTLLPVAICLGESIELEGTCSNGLEIKWYTDNSLATPITNTSVTPNSSDIYYALCRTPEMGCTSMAIPLAVTINSGILPPETSNIVICKNNKTTLQAICEIGSVSWYLNSELLNNSEVSPIVTTVYSAVCTSENCNSEAKDLVVTVIPKTAPLLAQANPAVIQKGSSSHLSANCDNDSTPQWFIDESLENSLVNTQVRPLETTEYFVVCGECSEVSTVIVEVIDEPENSNLSLSLNIKSDQPSVFKNGEEITLEIIVKNTGTVTMSDILIGGPIPNGLLLSDNLSWLQTLEGVVSLKSPIVSLEPSQELTLQISFIATENASGTLVFSVSIVGENYSDDILEDNTALVNVVICNENCISSTARKTK